MNPDSVYLGLMVEAVARIAEFIETVPKDEFDREWKLQNALIRELEIIGEAASKLSADFVRANPEVPWKEMTGLRHKLIHDYFEVDLDIVWRTATVNVPEIAGFLGTVSGG
jgi:uncharacterized protein with HEPN domain